MFFELLEKMKEFHIKKNADYAGDVPLNNLKYSEVFGIEAWRGVLIRMGDKWSRILELTKNGKTHVEDEKLEDTLLDMANYCLLCIILMREAGNNKSES